MMPISTISEESDIAVIMRPASAEDRVSTWMTIDVGISPDESLESLVRTHIGFS